jgi:ORF6N domain-containing protein
MTTQAGIPLERIERHILLIGGRKVLLDTDLAALYGVTTKRFNEQVRRNSARFPEDFMFRLTAEQWRSLRSQVATLELGRGRHRKYLPWAFTEHGAIMAATILNSLRATQVSVFVVRAFVRLRELLASDAELARRLDKHERRLAAHDQVISNLVSTLDALLTPPEPKRRRIGFL